MEVEQQTLNELKAVESEKNAKIEAMKNVTLGMSQSSVKLTVNAKGDLSGEVKTYNTCPELALAKSIVLMDRLREHIAAEKARKLLEKELSTAGGN